MPSLTFSPFPALVSISKLGGSPPPGGPVVVYPNLPSPPTVFFTIVIVLGGVTPATFSCASSEPVLAPSSFLSAMWKAEPLALDAPRPAPHPLSPGPRARWPPQPGPPWFPARLPPLWRLPLRLRKQSLLFWVRGSYLG